MFRSKSTRTTNTAIVNGQTGELMKTINSVSVSSNSGHSINISAVPKALALLLFICLIINFFNTGASPLDKIIDCADYISNCGTNFKKSLANFDWVTTDTDWRSGTDGLIDKRTGELVTNGEYFEGTFTEKYLDFTQNYNIFKLLKPIVSFCYNFVCFAYWAIVLVVGVLGILISG